MLRESVAPLSRYGDLLNGFMMPGTDIVNVKGKNMTLLTIARETRLRPASVVVKHPVT
jgi:hypothetical protein